MNKVKYILLALLIFVPVSFYGQGDQLMVTGTITSDSEGEIIGAQILEVDRNNRNVSAAITDYNGNFSMQIKNAENSIRFSYVGYKTQLHPIKDRRRFVIKLEESTQLTEVVVTARAVHNEGGFAIPRREISGAIQQISTEAFEGLSVSSIDDALQGRIAGLDIVGNSGNLGAGSTLRIRGTSSINSNAEPLIVINGIPYENNMPTNFDYNGASEDQFASLLNINPSDIEQITVLKDGAAAAIWGSRGSNGVISIKTKRGVKGPTRVQYVYRFSGNRQPAGIKMLNGDDYTMLMKQALFNPDQDEWAADLDELKYNPAFSEYENFNENTDWVDAVSQYGFTHDHNLNISGGGDKARYRVSFGYYDQTGTVIEQQMQRYTTLMNLDYQVSDRIRFTSDFAVTYTNNAKNLASDVGDGYNTENLLSMAYRKMPNVSIYQQDQYGNNTNYFYAIPQTSELDGSQRDLLNPVALAKLAKNDEKSMRIAPRLGILYDILDPDKSMLRYKADVIFEFNNEDVKRFLPREVTTVRWDNELINRSYGKGSEALSVYSDQNVTWVPSLGENHSLTLYSSFQIKTVKSRYQAIEQYGLPSSFMTDPTIFGTNRLFESAMEERNTMGILGSLHYAMFGRYILDLTIRRDGDSRFGYNSRWGNFPAASVKWILSDEKFMEPTWSWLSEFGMRAGYGVTGNAPNKNYLYFSRYDGNWGGYGNGYIDLPSVKPTSLKLANLKWEESSSYNAGFDLRLLDFKYNIDFNVYRKRTKDLLFEDQTIPSTSGFSRLGVINGGVIDNKGWELNFSTNKMIKTKDWTVDVNFNLSNQVNDIVSLSQVFMNAYNSEFNYNNESYLSRIQPGNALGSIYGFRYKGVYKYDTYEAAIEKEGTAVGPNNKPLAPVAIDADGNVIKDGNGNPVPAYFAFGTTQAYQFRGGDAIYEDINNDGTIDKLDIVYLGNSNPKFNGGFGSTVRYKNFSVNAFFNFRYGNKILNKARMESENMRSYNNQSTAVNWRWRKDGDITDMPRALYNRGYNSLGSDRYVEDGSFLRFKYLTFSYEFDKKAINKYMLNQLNVYLTLNNIVTFTKYRGVDPEVSINMNPSYGLIGVSTDSNKTPRPQYFTLGMTVGF